MAFRVELSPSAIDELDEIAEYIESRSSFEVADRWFSAIMDEIATLAGMPTRCKLAPEWNRSSHEVRLLLVGKRNRKYKVYFELLHKQGLVRVVHVRHWARKTIGTDELMEGGPDTDD